MWTPLAGNINWQLYQQTFSDDVPKSECLAPTYPSAWVVPASLDDDQIRSAAKYRSKQRMPVRGRGVVGSYRVRWR